MLHIVNGDATRARLEPAALPGELLVWRDILVEGPVAATLDIDALAPRRAPWLARRLGIPAEAYAENARAQATGLARAAAHEEIVLWFEQDLFCVANLAFLAAWRLRTPAAGRVSLIFPVEPLGEMESAQLAALFAERRPCTAEALAHAAAWWEAFASPDPRAFDALPHGPLPFLDEAARLHCARFPWTPTGLGAVEAAALAVLDETPRPFGEVFRAASRDERMRGHGMGDVQLAGHLHALAAGPTPLVTIGGAPGAGDDLHATPVASTAAGRAARDGMRDRLEAQTLDWWLGGVHLDGPEVWRWDPDAARLVAPRERRSE